MNEAAPQHHHSLREVFNALRWLARASAPWRLLPHDFPPWQMVYQQFRRWNESGSFEALVNDMRSLIRVAAGHSGQPSTIILDVRCKAAAKVEHAQAMTAISASEAAKSIWQSIRWDIYWC